MADGQVESIGADRQLFVDDHWIDSSAGVERVLHEPVAANIALEAEHPWDQIFSAYHLVLGDGSKWRMYYLCSGRGDGGRAAQGRVAVLRLRRERRRHRVDEA